MKKIAIVYTSTHHNNTEKLVNSCNDIDIYKVSEIENINLSQYDLVGFASGIYMGKFHKSITDVINKHIKELKDIFLVYTSGSGMKTYGKNYQKELESLGLNVVDIYSCKGYDTYAIWKLIGGIAKKHPNQSDFEKYKIFIEGLNN